MEIGKKVGKRSRRWIDAIFGGDKVLWTVIIVLLIFSMLLTFSATVYKPGGTPTAKLINQLVFIGAGIAALLVVHVIKHLRAHSDCPGHGHRPRGGRSAA